MVEKISRAAHDMEELTQALLLLARENEIGSTREQTNVNELLRDEISKAALLYQDKNLDIHFEQNHTLYLQGSKNMLGLVFGNLIRNACAYTNQGGVTIAVGDKFVEIADSGIGISDENLKAVFEPYYRIDNTVESGHGIGLSLVKRLTDRFGWPLTMNSEQGVGTTVRIHLPLSHVGSKEAAPNAAAIAGKKSAA